MVPAVTEEHDDDEGVGAEPPHLNWSDLPGDGFTIFSAPREHSRKPSAAILADLMLGFLGNETSSTGSQDYPMIISQPAGYTNVLLSLELFGRELHPGWTTWGNQVLHFQQRPLPS